MRLRPRPIWLLVMVVLGLLIVINRASLQSLHSEDLRSLAQRRENARNIELLKSRVDELEARVRILEHRRRP